jgi:hypothetical protein
MSLKVPAWLMTIEKGSRITSITPMNGSKLLSATSSGVIAELDLAKAVQRTQAFATVGSLQIQGKRSLSEIAGMPKAMKGIHAIVKDDSHPYRVGILSTSGNVLGINALHWRVQCELSMNSNTESELRGFRPEYANCLGFVGKRHPFFYTVRKGDERWIDFHDFDLGRTAFSLEFNKRVSAVCSAPDGHTILYALHQDEKIRAIGLL